ncbi:hypothetical protein M440DRAFT_293527 [Trichoderma longibrachiatum ATCC 18648]|uniref:Uncharacterized protein n=1 Tax=Trichoderma longibrachiatum ATCC 18648 TaxID=983965 RepID=A0A2T4C8F6_TRILO|nr:hypothetical protein M440DRAFT_293527 [Trichoderma longibrachiatum ATCC 18648]
MLFDLEAAALRDSPTEISLEVPFLLSYLYKAREMIRRDSFGLCTTKLSQLICISDSDKASPPKRHVCRKAVLAQPNNSRKRLPDPPASTRSVSRVTVPREVFHRPLSCSEQKRLTGNDDHSCGLILQGTAAGGCGCLFGLVDFKTRGWRLGWWGQRVTSLFAWNA